MKLYAHVLESFADYLSLPKLPRRTVFKELLILQRGASMLNALTIDVEDYYHVSGFESVVRFEDWERYESRVERNTQRILDLFDEQEIKATFFVLGWIAERYPRLIRIIQELGHEVACHGYAHQRVYTQSPEQFRQETRRAKRILEDITGQPVLGYRAASYSITKESLWALDVLCEEGFMYDSSIFPIHHDRYGIPDYQRFCHILNGHPGSELVEFPISTLRLAGTNIPIAGGGYLRFFPYAFVRWGLNRINAKERQPAMVYIHPWEIDPGQPRIPANALSRFRQYVNLEKTEARLIRLLQDFEFGPMLAVLQKQGLL
jgi:polysaccharide deacetylase family protein (PEP-CTERM system associated)